MVALQQPGISRPLSLFRRVCIGRFWICRASLIFSSQGVQALSTMVFSSHFTDGAMGGPGIISDRRALVILFAIVISMFLESCFQSLRGLTDVGFPAGTRDPLYQPSMGRGSLTLESINWRDMPDLKATLMLKRQQIRLISSLTLINALQGQGSSLPIELQSG